MKQWEHLFSDGVASVRPSVRPWMEQRDEFWVEISGKCRNWHLWEIGLSDFWYIIFLINSDKLQNLQNPNFLKSWKSKISFKVIHNMELFSQNNSILWSVRISLKTIPYCGQIGFQEVIQIMEWFSVWGQKKIFAGLGGVILPSRLPQCAVGAPHLLIHRKVL